jgi:DNA modification methylase
VTTPITRARTTKPAKFETGHSTQKPAECTRRPIENNSKPGDAVYDPFSGSGTTIIAGEMTARSVYAIELSPAYVDVAVPGIRYARPSASRGPSIRRISSFSATGEPLF